ncbi:hypothetical protein, partial [Lentzea kentuckyensis]|uniref:hypothetical protein n=1 Tax=Lentzea kentuckyensis TaxID=360086 RepID=UPI001B8052B6
RPFGLMASASTANSTSTGTFLLPTGRFWTEDTATVRRVTNRLGVVEGDSIKSWWYLQTRSASTSREVSDKTSGQVLSFVA